MGQIFILCNYRGRFYCIVYCFFYVLFEGEVYCYLREIFYKRVIYDENIVFGKLIEMWYLVQEGVFR